RDPQARRPGQGPAQREDGPQRARGVPLDPEGLHGPPPDDAGRREGDHRAALAQEGLSTQNSRTAAPAGEPPFVVAVRYACLMRFVMRTVEQRLPRSSVTTISCTVRVRPRWIAVQVPVTMPLVADD